MAPTRPNLVARILLLALTALAPPAGAGTLRSDVLYLLPREVGQIVYVDMRETRRSPHYPNLKTQIPPRFEHFANFLNSIGMNLDRDIDWLAWVFVPPDQKEGERLIGLAEGSFAPERVERYFRQQNLPIDTYRGQTLFPFGSGAGVEDLFFTFLDSSTAIFGTRPSVILLLETRFGAHENLLRNELMLARLDEVNGRSPVWAVFDPQYTRYTLPQIIPEIARFDEFGPVARRFRHSVLQIHLNRDLRIDFQAWCESTLDANAFSLLVQSGLFVERWRLRKDDPALSRVLENTDVNALGDRLQVRLTIAEQELKELLARRTFFAQY